MLLACPGAIKDNYSEYCPRVVPSIQGKLGSHMSKWKKKNKFWHASLNHWKQPWRVLANISCVIWAFLQGSILVAPLWPSPGAPPISISWFGTVAEHCLLSIAWETDLACYSSSSSRCIVYTVYINILNVYCKSYKYAVCYTLQCPV